MKRFLSAVTAILAFVLLNWFLLAAILYRVINVGNIAGGIICILLIFRFGFRKGFMKLRTGFYRRRISRIVYKIIIVCWAIFGIYAVIISALMIYTALSYPPDNNRTVIVLGAQVKPWGPSTMLRQRIDAAENYLNENPDAKAVLSGGKGNDEPVSEAASMYDNINIKDKSRLYLEDKSTNTRENLAFSKKIIENNSLNPRIAIVTDSYHQFRAHLIAKKEGIKDIDGIYSICTKNTNVGLILYPTYFVREWIAIPFELFK